METLADLRKLVVAGLLFGFSARLGWYLAKTLLGDLE